MWNKTDQNSNARAVQNGEAGFSLIEAIVAIFILTIGLIGTAAAITYALEFSAISRNVTKAKMIVTSSIEEIESMRNSRRLDFKQFANEGSVDNTGSPNFFAGFSNGFRQVSDSPGPDGVNGTNDDLSIAPGPDGIFGTPDDVLNPALARDGYTREIIITNLSSSLKKVVVNVRYTGSGGKIGEITGVSYLNDEARISR